jgi:NAD(P)-dependent dehydrogenase (short-subunit alcohol dehydrogenase family)
MHGIRLWSSAHSSFGVVVTIAKLRTHSPAGERQFSQSPASAISPRSASAIAKGAYSAAKFAVKGFTEALITDLRINAPHIKCSVVMPGQIGTSIRANTRKIHSGDRESDAIDAAGLAQARERFALLWGVAKLGYARCGPLTTVPA